jgi:hypothetical protein
MFSQPPIEQLLLTRQNSGVTTLGNLRSKQPYALIVALALSSGPLSAQAGSCDPELPQPAVEANLWEQCEWPSPKYLRPAGKPPPESAVLVDAPSHMREGAAPGSQPSAPAASGYVQGPLTPGQHLMAAIAPPAKAGYRPLTPVEKLTIFYQSTYSPYTFLSAAFDAGLAQAEGDFRGYGGGLQGYGKRYGAILADAEASIFFSKFFFPWILKQDPRYFRMEEGPLSKRALYAVSRVLVTRSDQGGCTFNSSRLLGRLVVKSLSNSYYPAERRGLGPTLRRTANGMITDASMSLAKEFWPDIRDKLFRKRLPQKVEGMVDRIVTGPE